MLLTGALSSSVTVCACSASAVVSDIPPEGCGIGGSVYGTGGTIGVHGPAFAFLCSSGRTRGVPYGWNRPIGIIPVLVGPVLG